MSFYKSVFTYIKCELDDLGGKAVRTPEQIRKRSFEIGSGLGVLSGDAMELIDIGVKVWHIMNLLTYYLLTGSATRSGS